MNQYNANKYLEDIVENVTGDKKDDYEFITDKPDKSKEIINGLNIKKYPNGKEELSGLNGTSGYGIGDIKVSEKVETGYVQIPKEVGDKLKEKLKEMGLENREIVVANKDHSKYFTQDMIINKENDTYISKDLANILEVEDGDEIKVYLRH